MFKEDQHLSEVWLGPPPNLYLTKRPHFSRAQNDLFFLARWRNTINGVQFPSCNGTVLNSCSEPVLVSLRLTHSSLSFSESLSLPLSFRPHCMCLTRLGLLFPASQPEHSKNLIYHLRPTGNAHTHIQTHTHTHTFTYSDEPGSSWCTFTRRQNTCKHWWQWRTLCACTHTCGGKGLLSITVAAGH